MELRLKPSDKNTFPLAGILIRGAGVETWLCQIQQTGLSLSSIITYPIPGKAANSLWGCLVEYAVFRMPDIGKNSYCQLVNGLLYIPERAVLYPALSLAETEKLFPGKHIFHPEFGLVALEEALNWRDVILLPEKTTATVKRPVPGVSIPKHVRSFQIKPVAPENVLENFEKTHFPEQQDFEAQSLNPIEKARLFLYRQLFRKNSTDANASQPGIKQTPLLSGLERLRSFFSNKAPGWIEKAQADYEELAKRNQKQLDQLLDLLKKDPDEALKYAIPLDMDGTVRGGSNGTFNMQKLWGNFSLFNNASVHQSASGTTVFSDDSFARLHTQYTNTAQALTRQGEYRKAAFIYLKLLKNYHLAAQTLEEGRLYQEAAAVYLQYSHDKEKAAACYEKGAFTMDAIALYKELNQDEKVGDLYASIHNREEAFFYYEKVVEGYKQREQYVKAALLFKNKMENPTGAQEMLLTGWRENRDAFNCLNNYFSNIQDIKMLGTSLHSIYENEVHAANRETFLMVLRQEYAKGNELSGSIKEMAHEVIVAQIPVNPSIVSELSSFNRADDQLVKDTMRFKINNKKNH
jgi:tetratricopeptide (TPR) repeat protein